tara:strand:+ start:512 stop:763 length:252 start_codon:yes stop_codon:yes gene_type:complete
MKTVTFIFDVEYGVEEYWTSTHTADTVEEAITELLEDDSNTCKDRETFNDCCNNAIVIDIFGLHKPKIDNDHDFEAMIGKKGL